MYWTTSVNSSVTVYRRQMRLAITYELAYHV
jgi:hypothetical protein